VLAALAILKNEPAPAPQSVYRSAALALIRGPPICGKEMDEISYALYDTVYRAKLGLVYSRYFCAPYSVADLLTIARTQSILRKITPFFF
jgi:hypothetical protein